MLKVHSKHDTFAEADRVRDALKAAGYLAKVRRRHPREGKGNTFDVVVVGSPSQTDLSRILCWLTARQGGSNRFI